jgi:hypothetical protein
MTPENNDRRIEMKSRIWPDLKRSGYQKAPKTPKRKPSPLFQGYGRAPHLGTRTLCSAGEGPHRQLVHVDRPPNDHERAVAVVVSMDSPGLIDGRASGYYDDAIKTAAAASASLDRSAP